MKVMLLLTEIGSAVPSHHAVSLLSAVLQRAGHQTCLVEAHRMDLDSLDDALWQHQPQVLAATAVTQQVGYVQQYITHAKRRWPHLVTMLGGTHATFRPEILDETPGLDMLCVNEGEQPILEYLSALESGRPVTGIPNLRVRTEDGEIVGPTGSWFLTEEAMSELPFEDRLLFPKWANTPRGVPLESKGIRPRFWFSRGCMFACSFCAVPGLRRAFPAKRYNRYPTVERTIAELEAVADRWTFSTWVADDDVISQRKSWLMEFADKYPERLKRLSWECNLRIETADEDVLRAFKATHCTLLKFGLESGDYDLRKRTLNRNITNEQTRHVFELARKHGLRCHTFNIVGFPDETRRQVWKTIRLNQQLRPDRAQISIFVPYPGSELGARPSVTARLRKHVDNYFSESPLRLTYLWPMEVKIYFRLFRLLVYMAYSPTMTWRELVGLARLIWDYCRKAKQRYDIEA